jgi:hypothetical protein
MKKKQVKKSINNLPDMNIQNCVFNPITNINFDDSVEIVAKALLNLTELFKAKNINSYGLYINNINEKDKK